MLNKDVINKIRNLSTQEQRSISYEELIKIIEPLTSDEIIVYLYEFMLLLI